jgi:helix-turn-helix, Psq domain
MKSSDTPKKEGPTKTWNEDSLNNALDALRTGTISANKASKAFGIPSSTLYKIARREGIRLAAPFNAAPTTWSAEDLEKALEGKKKTKLVELPKLKLFFFYSYSCRRSFSPKSQHRIWNSNR